MYPHQQKSGTVTNLVLQMCDSLLMSLVAVPGDLGNQLEAKLDKPSVVHYICYKKTDSFFTLWLNLELLVPVAIDCWIDNIRYAFLFLMAQTSIKNCLSDTDASTTLNAQGEFSRVKCLLMSCLHCYHVMISAVCVSVVKMTTGEQLDFGENTL